MLCVVIIIIIYLFCINQNLGCYLRPKLEHFYTQTGETEPLNMYTMAPSSGDVPQECVFSPLQLFYIQYCICYILDRLTQNYGVCFYFYAAGTNLQMLKKHWSQSPTKISLFWNSVKKSKIEHIIPSFFEYVWSLIPSFCHFYQIASFLKSYFPTAFTTFY